MNADKLSETDIQSLYNWIDSQPISKPKKNIARDFSDGTILSEIISNYIPKLVDKHNYNSASSISQKMYNWNTLNHKVFKKLSYFPSEELISNIVNCKQGYIELLLFELRQKIESYLIKINQKNHNFNLNIQQIRNLTPLKKNPSQIEDLATLNFSSVPNSASQNQDFNSNEVNTPQQQQIYQQQPNNTPYFLQKENNSAYNSTSNLYPDLRANKNYHNNTNHNTDNLVKCNTDSSANVQHIVEKDKMIVELRDTVQVLQLKISKLEKLLTLKDKKIDEFVVILKNNNLV